MRCRLGSYFPVCAATSTGAYGYFRWIKAFGPRYCEDMCLDAAAALEDKLGVITPMDAR
jgi:hypothetical protein